MSYDNALYKSILHYITLASMARIGDEFKKLQLTAAVVKRYTKAVFTPGQHVAGRKRGLTFTIRIRSSYLQINR